MSETTALVKTLVFQLDIRSNNEQLLFEAALEARSVYNNAVELAKNGADRKSIPATITDDADLVKNTTQRIVAKSLDAVETAEEYDDVNPPSHTKTGTYPLRMNYGEGYTLTRGEDGQIEFRISAKPYKHVTGILEGNDADFGLLEAALDGEEWTVGTAEALFRSGNAELHVDIRNTERTVREKSDSRTVVGVDVNEDNVALTALSSAGVEDTLVIDFPEIKYERHRYFTIRKRIERAEKYSIYDTIEGCEKRYIRDRLHKVSRRIVEWCQQFEKPCLVFEDLKGMRESIDYGARMNRRLHRIPFRTLQFYTSYKASFEGIPTVWADPAYTSQRCPLCGHTESANRHKKRFQCRECSHQDHSDRSASVNIAVKGIESNLDWDVPALNSLPQVTKVRRQASGAVDAPTVIHDTA